MKQKCKPGTLVISLDFELYWGMRDKVSRDSFRTRLQGIYQAIPLLLELFDKYNIAATWATVGFLHHQDIHQLQANLPAQLPTYNDSQLSPYPDIVDIHQADQLAHRLHFCPDLIDQIARYPQQEIATHTFSHYYCLEPGQTQVQFQADLEAAIETAQSRGITTKSIVFPRNQYNQAYLEVLKRLGIHSYRGNKKSPMYNSIKGDGDKASKRILRLLDNYFNLSGHNCYSLEEISQAYPFNIPASRFLRPYSSKLRFLDKLRLARITSGLDRSAEHGEIYHLWWHPHNFGADLAENVAFLTQVLQHYQMLLKQGKMRSLNMQQVAEICLQEQQRKEVAKDSSMS